MEESLVSIVLACYNEENNKLLQRTLEAINNQTYQNVEIIIVTDGSTDDTYNLINDFATQHNPSKWKILNGEKNEGAHAAYWKAIQNTKGKYIVWEGGSDDYSISTRIEKQVEYLEAHNEVSFCGGNYTYLDEEGNILAEIIQPENHDEIYKKAYESSIHFSTLTLRRELFDHIQLTSHDAGDVELRLELLADGFRAYNLQENLSFVTRGGKISSGSKRKNTALVSMYVELAYLHRFLNLTSIKRIMKHFAIWILPSSWSYKIANENLRNKK